MARTINQMSKDRQKAVRMLGKELRDIVTSCGKSQRRIARILNRRSKVPEISDLDALTVEFQVIQKQLDEYMSTMGDALSAFTLV